LLIFVIVLALKDELVQMAEIMMTVNHVLALNGGCVLSADFFLQEHSSMQGAY